MENVVAFNNELSGLYDTKPPISKAKMAAITKAAMRAIKFYKHVVQSVEKFILKCKPEYKVPGLYVIDSIVRQSRHQYGPEKDVFAPRFARNMKETFANLFRCAPEDKSRIIRVLNLWQKNNVFAPEVIQPIFDLADPNHPIYQMPASSMHGGEGCSADNANSVNAMINNGIVSMDNTINTSTSNINMPLVDDKNSSALPDLSSLSHDKSISLETSEQCQKHTNVITKSITSICTLDMRDQLHNFRSNHCCACNEATGCSDAICVIEKKKHFEACCSNYNRSSSDCCCHPHLHTNDHGVVGETYNKKEDKDENICRERFIENSGNSNKKKIAMDNKDLLPPAGSSNILDNNNLKQLLNDPNVLRQLQTLQNFTKFKQQEDNKHHKLSEIRIQDDAFQKHIQNVLKTSGAPKFQESNEYNAEVEFVSMEQNIEVINLDGNDSRSPSLERDRYKRRRSRSGSQRRDRRGASRDRRRRTRSRSTERSRSPRLNRRRNSRERERNSRDSRDNRDKERDREHERERRKKGLPELKKEHLSVCSTTLWVGHLSKLVYQEELSDTFGEYGDIVSIDQIVPRGCAFIVMHRRQDAYKAMQNLKNHKLQGRAITISWAAGKGVKSKEWKDYWDLDLGVTYIPWNKLDENTDFDSMEEGGMFDEDSMPTWMQQKIQHAKSQRDKRSDLNNQTGNVASGGNLLFGIDTTQPPPGPPSLMSMALSGQYPMAPPISAPPRPLLGAMGMPIQGLPMPPNLITGMHPPHAMMMPPGMMPPGYHIPQGGPPSLNTSTMAIPPPNTPQFAPPPTTVSISTTTAANNSSDDQMDIVMDEDDGVAAVTSQLNFNQPPPLFNSSSLNGMSTSANPELNGTGEIFSRDRNRSSSRWSGSNRGAEDNDDGKDIWRESSSGNFNENRIGSNSNRSDFMNETRNRVVGGVCSRGPEFFPNLQANLPPNRFNQPTSLLQMRIAPPSNMFNTRMSGPKGGGPMFLRCGPQTGGGRQQGPGGYFNTRNPFNDGVRGMGRAGRIMDCRGNRGGKNSYSSSNWSDEEGDDMVFKRRGSNRFRDEARSEDRNHRGGRHGSGEWCHQRSERREYLGNRRNLRNQGEDKQNEESSPVMSESKSQNNSCDTEDDWDRELEEYDARVENAEKIERDKTNMFGNTSETTVENANDDGIPEISTNDVTNDRSTFDQMKQSISNLPEKIVDHSSKDNCNESGQIQITNEGENISENFQVVNAAEISLVPEELTQE